ADGHDLPARPRLDGRGGLLHDVRDPQLGGDPNHLGLALRLPPDRGEKGLPLARGLLEGEELGISERAEQIGLPAGSLLSPRDETQHAAHVSSCEWRWPATGRRDKERPVSQGVLTMSRSSILLDGNSLTLEQLERIAAGGAQVALAPAARERLVAARALVDRIAAGDAAAYGINTGFGNLAEVRIAKEDLGLLQRNLIL